MDEAPDLSKTNGKLRREGVGSVEYAGEEITGDEAVERLLLARLDGSSRLELAGHFQGHVTLGKPDSGAGYTYHGHLGGVYGLDREQLVPVLRYHRGPITVVL